PFPEAGKNVGDNSHRLIQVDQTRQIVGNDLGIDIFNRAAPGTTGFVTIPGALNSGTAVFGKTVVTNPSGGIAAGKRVDIQFTSATEYKVSIDGVELDSGGPGNDGTFIYTDAAPGKLLGDV